MDSTNHQKKKPLFLAAAATVCHRKMMKVPFYYEPLRLFVFYNLFKGEQNWKVDNKNKETKNVKLMSQSEIKKTAPFVKMNPWDLSQSGIIESVIYLRFLLRDAEKTTKEKEVSERFKMEKMREERMNHWLDLSSKEY